jgi:hypothetical protein
VNGHRARIAGTVFIAAFGEGEGRNGDARKRAKSVQRVKRCVLDAQSLSTSQSNGDTPGALS